VVESDSFGAAPAADGEPDVREPAPARLREPRFDSLDELKAAVKARCREHIRERANGAASALKDVQGTETFDVDVFEARLRESFEACARRDDSFVLMAELDGALSRVIALLDAAPEEDDDYFTSLLRHAIGTRCQGRDGSFDVSFGDRWRHLQRLDPDGLPRGLRERRREQWPLGSTPRARLVAGYAAAPVGFWGRGVPTVRDLACITLLAGLFPGGARQQQRDGHGLTLPTVLEVIGAEDAAVQATLRHAPLPPRDPSQPMTDVERYAKWVRDGMRWPAKEATNDEATNGGPPTT
jgi:hypothetical protein